MTTLLDSTIRRDAQLLRFGTYLKSEYITPAMQSLSKELPKLLVGFDELNKSERTKLAREIRSQVSVSMGAMFDDITNELHLLTDDEAEFMLDLYDDYTTATMTALNAAAVVSTADNALISLESGKRVTTGVWMDFVKENISTANKMVDGVVLKGFRDGQSLQSIVQELRGSYNRGTKRYTGGVINGRMTQYAETLALTGVSHYANQARDRFAVKNNDIIDSEVFFATLDVSTTPTCSSLHLNEYKLTDPSRPILPLHYRERSVKLYSGPGIDPLEGNRPLVGGKNSKAAREEFEKRKARQDALRNARAAKRAEGELTPSTASKIRYKGRSDSEIFDIESVSAKTSAQSFYERQPTWFLDEYFGSPTKTKLFLDGKLPIKSFTDIAGRPLTLKELKATAAGEKAYRRAGLD